MELGICPVRCLEGKVEKTARNKLPFQDALLTATNAIALNQNNRKGWYGLEDGVILDDQKRVNNDTSPRTCIYAHLLGSR